MLNFLNTLRPSFRDIKIFLIIINPANGKTYGVQIHIRQDDGLSALPIGWYKYEFSKYVNGCATL